MIKFRLKAKKLLLTYSKCFLTKNDALKQLERILYKHNIESYLISKEYHKDSISHLHCLFRLKSSIDFRNPHTLDLIDNNQSYHGNYQTCKKYNDAISYLCKQDSEPLTNLDIYKTQVITIEERAVLTAQTKGYYQAIEYYKENETLKNITKRFSRVENQLKRIAQA